MGALRQRNSNGGVGELPRNQGGEHQAAGGSLRLPRWPWHHCACVWAPVELGLRHWPSLVCDVVLLHEPGPGTAGHPEELEGEQGLQERRVPAAQGVGREGGQLALAGAGRAAHHAQQGTGGLHWREGGGPLQGRHLPLLRWQGFCTGFFEQSLDQSVAAAACSLAAWILWQRRPKLKRTEKK